MRPQECHYCVVRERGGVTHYRDIEGRLCGKCRMYITSMHTGGRPSSSSGNSGLLKIAVAVLIIVAFPSALRHGVQMIEAQAVGDGASTISVPNTEGMPAQPSQREIFIPSGVLTYAADRDFVVPFVITSPPGTEKFLVKLVDPDTETTVLTVFLNPGETVETTAPAGSFHLLQASGPRWFGERKLFGKGSSYARSRIPLIFVANADGYRGHTVQMQPRAGGNLHMDRLSKDAF